MTEGHESIFQRLAAAGYECYLVGGSVRDRLLGRAGADFDFTTNARPDALLRIFRHSHYPNRFGTVLVDIGGLSYEVTTYRGEGRYSDHRHPDQVAFVDRLEDDLRRRDFTINAMAMDAAGSIVDPFGGRAALEQRLIRAVGDPSERLAEDPLRMMRAARLATQLDFSIEPRTAAAIAADAGLLSIISRERVRDELLKLLGSPRAARGIELLGRLGLLEDVLPSLAAARRLEAATPRQNGAYRHALRSLRHCHVDALLRLAALLHALDEQDEGATGNRQPAAGTGDVGAGFKPARSIHEDGEGLREGEGPPHQAATTQAVAHVPSAQAGPQSPALSPNPEGRGGEASQPSSPLPALGEGEGEGPPKQAATTEAVARPAPGSVGARHASPFTPSRRDLDRLRLSGADLGRVIRLIDAIPSVPPDLPADERSARRLLSAYGRSLPDVLRLVEAHRGAAAGPRAAAGLDQLRALRRLAREAQRRGDPLTIADLALNGDDLVGGLGLPPAPAIGRLLRLLLDRVLDDPALNTRQTLLEIATKL